MRGHYRNPVYDRPFADPFVLAWEGVYYAFATDHEAGEQVFPVLRSTDLAAWEPLRPAMKTLDPDFGHSYWAPEVAFDNGVFYLYYSVGHEDKGHQLRVATSLCPEGPYKDTGRALLQGGEHPFYIDPHPFQDIDGAWYLYFARDFVDEENGARVGTALAVDRMTDMLTLAGEQQTVLRATKDWQRYESNRLMYGERYDWHTLEGPFVVRREGRYYCFFSGGCWKETSYGVDYASAESPLGPWVGGENDRPRVLRTVPGEVLGPGHNSMAPAPDGIGEFIVYHAWDPAMSARTMRIDRLTWTPTGPLCAGPSTDNRPV